MNLRRGLRALALVSAAAIVAFFLWRAVAAAWGVLGDMLSDPPWLLLGVGLLTASIAMGWIAVVWVWLLRALQSPIGMKVGIATYFVGESTKYLPGALWPVVGRGEIAVRFGAKRVAAYTSVLYSLLLNFVLAGMVASLLTAPFALAGPGWSSTIWVLVLLPIGLVLLHPRFINPVVDFAHRHTGLARDLVVLPWATSIRFVALYLPAWAMIGVTSYVGARIIGAEPAVASLLFATYLAWVVGFLAVLAPTGLGVREAVFVAILGPSIGPGPASAIALLSRVAYVFADALGAVLGSGIVGAAARRAPQVSVASEERGETANGTA